MFKYGLLFVLFCLIVTPAQAQTASASPSPAQPSLQPQMQAPAPAQPLSPAVLDDSHIQKLFDESLSVVTDAQATHDFMEKHYDASFAAKITTTTSINGNPSKTESQTFGKKEAMEDAANMYSHGKVEDFQGSIVKIDYSPDHKYAFLSNTAQATYALNITLTDGRNVMAHLVQAQGCVELLTLTDGVIKYLKSDCNINQSLRP